MIGITNNYKWLIANQHIYKLWMAYLIFHEWFIGPVDVC